MEVSVVKDSLNRNNQASDLGKTQMWADVPVEPEQVAGPTALL